MWHALSLPQTGYEPASGRREALPETLLTDAMRCLAFWKFNYNSTPEPADAQMAARHSPLKGSQAFIVAKVSSKSAWPGRQYLGSSTSTETDVGACSGFRSRGIHRKALHVGHEASDTYRKDDCRGQ